MTNNFMLLLPVLLVIAGAIGLMVSSAYPQINNKYASYGAALSISIALIFQLFIPSVGHVVLFESIFNGIVILSGFTKAAGLIILACALFTIFNSLSYFRQNNFCTPEYYALILFATSGMLLLTMTQELITSFIALEIMSLAIYILVGYNKRNIVSTEAVLKYLMLGAFAGAFFAMGSAFIYGATGSTKFALIGKYASQNGFLTTPALLGGTFLLFVAFLFKAAAFPFHAWVIDVYDGASIPVTGFMATALKTAIFAVFANFLFVDASLHNGWINFLFYIAILTMFVGNLIAIGQNSLKRMLAASGIVHSGYLIVALIAFSTQEFSASVIAYYLAAYAAATLGMFSALSYLSGEGEKRIHFDDFKGLAKSNPGAAFAITIFLLSMAGIPPTAGFMGKLYIIISAINAGQIVLAVFAIVSSIISIWYYLRLIINMYFYVPQNEFIHNNGDGCCKFERITTYFLAFIVFAISLYPLSF